MDRSADAKFRSQYGTFEITAFGVGANQTHVALWMGDTRANEPLLTRVQSKCTTGTAFAAVICDCGEQVQLALTAIADEGRGLFLYLDEEARGHGMLEKVNGMAEMNRGATTVTAYTGRGLLPDLRDYSDAVAMLKALRASAVLRLMTNNPAKGRALTESGYMVERVPLEAKPTDLTYDYLLTKKREFGHEIASVE